MKAMRTIYIKPPAAIYADDVVQYADICQHSFSTIKALNEAAGKETRSTRSSWWSWEMREA